MVLPTNTFPGDGDPGGPGTGGGGGAIGGGAGGTASPGMQTVLSVTVTLVEDGVVDVSGSALLGFDSVPLQYRLEVWIDGLMVWSPGGTYPGDTVSLDAPLKKCAAGPVTVDLKFKAAVGVHLADAFLKVRAFNAVSG